MARDFNGTSDDIELSVGSALSGQAYGTWLVIAKPTDTAVFRTLLGYNTSAGAFIVTPLQMNDTDILTWDGETGYGVAVPQGVFSVFIARKGPGTVNARLSQYRYDTGVWRHDPSTSTHADLTGIDSTDRIGTHSSTGSELWDGAIELMAIWKDKLPFTADEWGDKQIEANALQFVRHALYNLFVPASPLTVGVGTRGAGTTTTTPTYPTNGNAAGNMAIAARTIKPSTATATAESGWTNLLDVTGGTGSQGIDTGPQRLSIEYREEAGGAASPTFDQASSPNAVTSALFCYSKDSGASWDIVGTSGDDATHGTGRSATADATLDMKPGDVILLIAASDTDSGTSYTSPSLTASGFTFTTPQPILIPGGSATGQDVGMWAYEARVLTGSGSATLSFSASSGPSSCGRIAFVRLRASGVVNSPPDWMVEFNTADASQSLVDITGGGGNQVSVNGTTVVDGPPFGWGADPIDATVVGGAQVVGIGQVSETDSAKIINEIKTVGQTSETDASQAVGKRKQLVVGTAAEVDKAVMLAKLVQRATEADAATAMVKRKLKKLDPGHMGRLNYAVGATTPDHTDYAWGTEIDIRGLCSLADLTPGFSHHLASQETTGSTDKAFAASLHANGAFRLAMYPDGTNSSLIGPESSVTLASVGITEGKPFWWRQVFVGNDGASGRYWNYYYSLEDVWADPDDVIWQQLGSANVTDSGANTSIFNSTQPLQWNAMLPEEGEYFYIEYRSSVGGTKVAALDLRTKAYGATTVTDDVNGRTWTLSDQQVSGGPGGYVRTVPEEKSVAGEISIRTAKTGTFTQEISDSLDDAAENSDGTSDTTSTTLVADSVNDYLGFRFQNVAIPQGAVIQSAIMKLTLQSSDKNDAEGNFYGEAADNAAAFANGGAGTNSISGRTRTTENVAWTTNDLGSIGTVVDTPELKTILQPIINRAGWASGNALAIHYKHNSATDVVWFTAISDLSARRQAKLIVTYTAPVPVGQVAETDAAGAITRRKAKVVGTATETDSSLTINEIKTIGRPSESDTAQAITRVKAKLVATTTETDASQAIAKRKLRVVGTIAETDASQTIIRPGGGQVGQVSEADVAKTIAEIKQLSIASEIDVAQAIAKRKAKLVATTSEVDAASAIARLKAKLLQTTSETDASASITHLKVKLVGTTSETDTALTIVHLGAGIVNAAIETDVAKAVRQYIATAEETDTAQGITVVRRRVLGITSETDAVFGIAHTKRKELVVATEADLAQFIAERKALGVAADVEAAQAISKIHLRLLGTVAETTVALAIARQRGRVVGTVTEADLALAITAIGGLQLPVQFKLGVLARLFNVDANVLSRAFGAGGLSHRMTPGTLSKET